MFGIPKDFPVKPLRRGQKAKDKVTCGTCGRSWDDSIATSYTPTPSARCPFEVYHQSETLVNRTLYADKPFTTDEELIKTITALLETLNEDIFTDAPEMSEAVAKMFDAKEQLFFALVGLKERVKPKPDALDKCKARYRQAAIDNHCEAHVNDGELEVDSNAVVSLSPDSGAYVQAWIWVARADVADHLRTFKE